MSACGCVSVCVRECVGMRLHVGGIGFGKAGGVLL